MITLDIISDPICPWCYIGKALLDRALEAHPAHPFDMRWRPFQLNPEMPAEGIDRRAYLEAKFGGPKGAAETYGRVAEAGRAAGLALNFEAIKRTPNTIDAHRLIHWARLERAQTRVVDALFQRYFVQGEDISDHGVLTEVAVQCEMDGALAARLLASDADRDVIVANDQEARQIGVTGVPTFVLAARHVLTGAQPVEVWRQVLDDLAGATVPTS